MFSFYLVIRSTGREFTSRPCHRIVQVLCVTSTNGHNPKLLGAASGVLLPKHVDKLVKLPIIYPLFLFTIKNVSKTILQTNKSGRTTWNFSVWTFIVHTFNTTKWSPYF